MAKVFVFGIDGATFDLILPLVEEGKLPNFAQLLEAGAWSPLESVPSMRSAAAWTTFLTGKNPGKHGLYEFFESVHGTYDVKFVNGGMRHGKSVWSILSEQGKKVGVINVPMTYPAEQINGFQISGLDAPSTTSPGFCHPPELLDELEKRFGTYIIEPGLTACIVQDRPQLAIDKLHEELQQKEDITKYLMQKTEWDFFAVVFRSLDAAQHCFWKYMDKQHPLHDPKEAGQFSTAIADAYRQLDRSLGVIRELLDDDTVFMVMSDHGFGRKHPANNQLNHWLASKGLLQFSQTSNGKLSRSWRTRLLGGVFRQVVGRTPRRLKQTLARFLPGLRDRMQSRLMYANIDWSNTRAFSDDLLPNIRINLRGREPDGIVEPGNEYNQLVQEVREGLMSCRDSVTGQPIVEAAFHRDEIYHGPNIEAAPDLLIRWREDVVIDGIALPKEFATASKASGSLIPGEDPRVISGDHKLHGVFMIAGPGIQAGKRMSRAHLSDLAPTMLSIAGLPVPDDMDGQVLQEAFVSPVNVNKVRAGTISTSEPNSPEADYSEHEQAAIHKRLRDLGYIE